jgi:predicted chitinase
MAAIQPTNNTGLIVDEFIRYATIHLTTVSGMANTISLYPPLSTPAPGVVLWTGYTVPPAAPSTPSLPDTTQQVSPQALEEATTLSPESEAAANFAEEQGYGGSEAVAIGLTVGERIRSGEVSINDLSSAIPPKARTAADRAEPEPSSTEKVEGCDGAKLPTPNKLLIDAMKKYGIDTPIRRAHFLAQCAHESGGFKWVKEFASGAAYEGRKDLGNIQTGDGVKFKGRGYIQLTGRANYTQFKKGVTDDIITNPIVVESKYPAETAAWFWKTRKFNDFANDDSVATLKKVTKRVNGGYNGYDDRKKYFCGYWKILKENPSIWT